MPDNSLVALPVWHQKEDRWLAQLVKVDPAALVETAAWVVHGVLRERLEAERDARVCREELWRVNHMTGWQTQLPGGGQRTAARHAGVARAGALAVPQDAYAEQLALEQGMYSSDAAGLVAVARVSERFSGNVGELGVHVKGWSRQQAIDFRIKYSVMEPEFQTEQVDRRIAWLGQGHAYAVGSSEILSLREEAKKALGPKFDLKEFHSRVLEDGPITVPMLRDKIRRWIASTR